MQAKRTKRLKPYMPGEQPKDRVYIKLNANENPYPPSARVTEALAQTLKDSMRSVVYPDPDSRELRDAVAALLNKSGGVLARAQVCTSGLCPAPQDELGFTITPDMIFCGNGSDEVLSFAFYAFFDDDVPLVTLDHTYSFYPVYALFYGIELVTIPLDNEWRVDTSALAKKSCELNANVIFANPNSPTGTAVTRNDIRVLLEKSPRDRVVLVDEAYVDFGGESALPLLRDFDNLVIVRTFSKSLSAAGLRLGYAVASPQLIETLNTVKNSFNHFPVDALAQCAGKAACEDARYYAANAVKIAKERGSFSAFLTARAWTVLPSQANFVFAKKERMRGKEIYEKIRAFGILIRHFDKPGISDFVRITIGTAEQMAALKKAFEELP
jgi:histidinol-phosphate aminotransferase